MAQLGSTNISGNLSVSGAITATTIETASVAPHAIVRLTSGAGNWTVPAGVSRIKVMCAGGGGGGGGGSSSFGGGGGGGGTLISDVLSEILSVTPGQVIAYSVGVGGSGGNSATGNAEGGGPGGSTSFGGATTRLGSTGGAGGSNTSYPGQAGSGPTPGGVTGQNGTIQMSSSNYTYGDWLGGYGGGYYMGAGGGGTGGKGGSNHLSSGTVGQSGIIVIEY